MNGLRSLLLAAAVTAAPLAAQAATGSLGTNNGLPIIALTSAGLGGAATLSSGTVYPSSYSAYGIAVAPAGASDTSYLAAGPGPGAPLPNATLTFAPSTNYVSFLWGSPDSFNTLSLTTTTGTYAFTTASLGIVPTNGTTSFSQYVQFLASSSTEQFLTMTFSSNPYNAFEASDFRVAAAPGPIAGAGIPALLAAAGLLWTRRRRTA